MSLDGIPQSSFDDMGLAWDHLLDSTHPTPPRRTEQYSWTIRVSEQARLASRVSRDTGECCQPCQRLLCLSPEFGLFLEARWHVGGRREPSASLMGRAEDQ